MKKIFFLLIIICGFTNFIFSWDAEAAKYFPMEVGNSWTYTRKIFAPPLNCFTPTNSYNFKVTITGDSVINGHRYFKFSDGNLLRLDSTSMNVYKRNGNTECITDSLLARIYDFVHDCTGSIQVMDTNIIVFAGQKRFTKAVSFPGLTRRIMYGIGLYYFGGCELFSGTVDELKGCVINGVLIGDTVVNPVNYDFLQYLPLQVGNAWVYRTYRQGPWWICYAYEKYQVTSTQMINNKTYYVINNVTNLFNPICSVWNFPVRSRLFSNVFIRIDSLSSNIYGLDTCIIDSLAATEGDSVRVCNYPYARYCDTSTQLIFGNTKKAKNFITAGFETYEQMWYIEDFGFARYHYSYPGPGSNDMQLMGCVLNGIVYGDTNAMVGINNVSIEIPDKFSLFQNYPNPFNPTTSIRFNIPSLVRRGAGVVVLKVYDILGREIAVLVNEHLSPGTYEVEFDGTNYSSGVYYYKIINADYSAARKMVLVK